MDGLTGHICAVLRHLVRRVACQDRVTHQRRGRRLLRHGICSRKNCAGTRIHFENDNRVVQRTPQIALDPALALVSSAHYYAGELGRIAPGRVPIEPF